MKDQDKTKDELIEELAEMRRREEQWHSVAANTPIFVWLVDRAGTIQYINRTAPGLALTNTIGKKAFDFVEPSYGEIVRECIERVFDTGQTGFYESLAVGPNGSLSSYETYASPVTVGDQVVAVTLIATDITQRKRAEQELRESEERYRLLTESIPIPLGRYTIDGKLFECNCRWYEYTGQTAEEARGHGWMETLHPDDTQRVAQTVKEALDGGERFHSELRLRRASDGSYRWHLPKLFRDGMTAGRSSTGSPLASTLRTRSRPKQALAEREARLLRSSGGRQAWASTLLILPLGNCTTSSVLDRIFGIPADYEERLTDGRDSCIPMIAKEMLDYFNEVVGEKKLFDREYRIVRYWDKQVRWVHGRGRLQFNEDGQPVSMLGTVQDITERKQAEEALQESEERFRLLVEAIPQPIWRSDAEAM